MRYLFVVLLIILLLFIANSSVLYKKYWVSSLLAFIFLVIISGFVTYTPDMDGYIYWFENESGRDLLFNFFSSFFKRVGVNNFQYVHLSYIAFSSFLLVVFVNKFKVNSFIVVILYISILFIYFTTQIRFFLGFFSMCLSLYYSYKNNKINTVLFFLIGIASHLSLVVTLPLLYIIKLDVRKIYKIIIYSNLFILLVGPFIFSIAFLFISNDRFLGYAETENYTTILGATFTMLPPLITLLVTVFYREKNRENLLSLKEYDDLNFLFKSSIVFYILFGVAFIIQIVGSRFIIPALLFQILFLFTLSNKLKSPKIKIFTYLMIFFNVFFIYIFPSLIFSESSQLRMITSIFESNYLLKHLLLW